jgi:hypothetical protein
MMLCESRRAGVTPRDGLIGAGVMLGVTLLLKALSAAAMQNGLIVAGGEIERLVFPVALTLSMPFWLMKGAPWKAQAAIVGATLAILVLIG